jgi:hypothetical protein
VLCLRSLGLNSALNNHSAYAQAITGDVLTSNAVKRFTKKLADLLQQHRALGLVEAEVAGAEPEDSGEEGEPTTLPVAAV